VISLLLLPVFSGVGNFFDDGGAGKETTTTGDATGRGRGCVGGWALAGPDAIVGGYDVAGGNGVFVFRLPRKKSNISAAATRTL
jgi:hypothetical protein